MTATMSLVEVSPSTLIMLKVFCTSAERAFCSISGEMAQSVVMNTSMVAIFGCIMPLPLAMPPSLHVLPPAVNSTATSLSRVSVVMMASATSSLFLPSAAQSGGMPVLKGSMLMRWPMTPVEATMTSSAAMPSSLASSAQVSSAISMPSALQVLALPLLQMTARALPSARCFLVTSSGAPLTRFVV